MTSPSPDTPARPPRGDTLLRVALVLFFVGLAAVVAIFVTSATGHTPGLMLYLVSMACPVGFLLAVVAALRAGRRVRGEE